MALLDFSDSVIGGGGLGPLQSNAIGKQAFDGIGGAGLDNAQDGILGGLGSLFSKGGPASIALGGLETLGSIWNSFQQNKLAKKSLKFQKDAFKTNLANSTKVYNTALEDRIRARYATEGRSSEADAKIAANRL